MAKFMKIVKQQPFGTCPFRVTWRTMTGLGKATSADDLSSLTLFVSLIVIHIKNVVILDYDFAKTSFQICLKHLSAHFTHLSTTFRLNHHRFKLRNTSRSGQVENRPNDPQSHAVSN